MIERKNLNIYRGDTCIFDINVSGSAPVDFTGGKLLMAVRAVGGMEVTPDLQVVDNRIAVIFSPNQTRSMNFSEADYDLRYVANGDVVTLVRGKVYVTGNIADAGEQPALQLPVTRRMALKIILDRSVLVVGGSGVDTEEIAAVVAQQIAAMPTAEPGAKGDKGDPGTVPQSVLDQLYAKSQLYVQARLGLIANGGAGEGTNYNFSAATLNKTDAAAGFGCFQTGVLNGIVLTDEYIAIDPGSNYRFSFYAKTLVKNGNSQAFAIIDCYDSDKLSIQNEHLPFVTFRLAADAKIGDTSVKIHADDIAAVTTAMRTYGNAALLYIGLAEYKNSFGYAYKSGVYTRNLLNTTAKAGNSHSISADGTFGEFGSGLTKDVPAGTVMTLSRTGGVYLYPLSSLNNSPVPEEWTRYSGNIAGSVLRGGTAFVRVGWQFNRLSNNGNITAVSAVNLIEI